MANPRVPRRLRIAGAIGAAAGAALFVWSIRTVGADAVVEGVRRLGAAFILVVLLGGVRHLTRASGWMLCMEPGERLSLGRAFAAYLAGDSLGNVTPFGFLISEPSKIVLVRNLVTPRSSIAALTVENLLYSATVAVMLVAGTAALLLSFSVPTAIRVASLATLGGALLTTLLVGWVLATRRRLASRTIARLIARGIGGHRLQGRLAHVREIEDRIFGFADRHPWSVVPILAIEAAYHVAAVFEIWVALRFITGSAPSLLTAFVLEYVNRTITIVFQFIPMWLGVDEAGTGLATTVLRLGSAPGVTLAVVRKGRVLAWTALGVALLLHQGLSLKGTVREAELLADQRAG